MIKESGISMQNTQKQIRTRYAPSPTGPLHMGGVRTALFNYLFSKKEKGIFILRIEDTDKARSKPEWEKDITENLSWLGLQWDEFYRQSERTAIYKKYLEQLLEQGKAYYCFCKPEELEAIRQDQLSRGVIPHYTGKCRGLGKEECESRLKKGEAKVIRFIGEKKTITFDDLIRGKISFDTELLGDIVIAKDLETPLYNFSVVVDDYEMNITHVIRGEDHIPNTPKQILLQEALGLPRPLYAHLPLLLGEDRTKLSKRHGDQSVARYRTQGYLPEAMINFLALLGWNPGTEEEIFSIEELIKEFSLERVQKAGAVFNEKRLNWLNASYIRKKSPSELTQLVMPYLPQTGLEIKKLEQIIALYQERMQNLSEIAALADYFFVEQLDYPKELLTWKNSTPRKTKEALEKLETILSAVSEKDWERDTLANILLGEAEKEKDRGYLLWPLRTALTGKQASAGPFEVATVLGKEKTLERIKEAQQKLTAI